jgi:hypothetical protein
MSKLALAQQLLTQLGRALSLDSLALDEKSQSCVLLFDDQLVVNIEFDSQTDRLVFSAYLHEIPAQGAESLLRELMSANLYWHRTGGATLCLEEGTGGVILVYGHSVGELDSASVEAVLENFVNQAQKWGGRLKKLVVEVGASIDSGGVLPSAGSVVYG